MPVELVGTERKRLFEGSRLLFGFILENARSAKLHITEDQSWPYIGAFQTFEVRNGATNEAVWEPVRTQFGIIERNYFEAFQGLLESNPMQPTMIEGEMDLEKLRIALLSRGSRPKVTILSRDLLASNYTY